LRLAWCYLLGELAALPIVTAFCRRQGIILRISKVWSIGSKFLVSRSSVTVTSSRPVKTNVPNFWIPAWLTAKRSYAILPACPRHDEAQDPWKQSCWPVLFACKDAFWRGFGQLRCASYKAIVKHLFLVASSCEDIFESGIDALLSKRSHGGRKLIFEIFSQLYLKFKNLCVLNSEVPKSWLYVADQSYLRCRFVSVCVSPFSLDSVLPIVWSSDPMSLQLKTSTFFSVRLVTLQSEMFWTICSCLDVIYI